MRPWSMSVALLSTLTLPAGASDVQDARELRREVAAAHAGAAAAALLMQVELAALVRGTSTALM